MEKEILVSSKNFKTINPKPGASWKAFNIYQILGNDGITYETTDKEYFESIVLGSTIKFKYNVESKESGGRVYTSYKIDRPRKGGFDPKVILDRLDLMEKNLLAAIELKGSIPKMPQKSAPVEDLSVDIDDSEGNY